MCSLGGRQREGRYGGEELVQGQKDKQRTRTVEVLFKRKNVILLGLQCWSCMKVEGKKLSTDLGGLTFGYFLLSFTVSRVFFKHNDPAWLEVRQKIKSHQFELLPVRLSWGGRELSLTINWSTSDSVHCICIQSIEQGAQPLNGSINMHCLGELQLHLITPPDAAPRCDLM